MLKYTKHFLKKIEDLMGDLDYIVRYERGNFKSGYCIVEDRRIAVINRFYETEARINVLIEILGTIQPAENQLDEKQEALYKSLVSRKKEAANDTTESTSKEETKPNPVESTSEIVENQLEVDEVVLK